MLSWTARWCLLCLWVLVVNLLPVGTVFWVRCWGRVGRNSWPAVFILRVRLGCSLSFGTLLRCWGCIWSIWRGWTPLLLCDCVFRRASRPVRWFICRVWVFRGVWGRARRGCRVLSWRWLQGTGCFLVLPGTPVETSCPGGLLLCRGEWRTCSWFFRVVRSSWSAVLLEFQLVADGWWVLGEPRVLFCCCIRVLGRVPANFWRSL